MNKEDKERLTKVWLYMNLYFFILLFFGTFLTVYITYQIPSPMEFSCPSYDRVITCQEFKEETRPVYELNETLLNTYCGNHCYIETLKDQDDYSNCYRWCVEETEYRNVFKYISGNETYFRCIK